MAILKYHDNEEDTMQPSPRSPSMRLLEFWLTTSLLILISLVLVVATIAMMRLGGPFLPFGFDSDLITNAFVPPFIFSFMALVALVIAVVLIIAVVQRRRHAH
jgi:multisubunit Na+/H+ antiporter MnhB subunit